MFGNRKYIVVVDEYLICFPYIYFSSLATLEQHIQTHATAALRALILTQITNSGAELHEEAVVTHLAVELPVPVPEREQLRVSEGQLVDRFFCFYIYIFFIFNVS